MCGINGIVNFQKPRQDAQAVICSMNSALIHRGPDSEGIFHSVDGCASLGARRLSIVDVKNGRQPVSCSRGNAEYSCVMNGEIYNFRELRQELKGSGHVFENDSDTEVVLKSYMEWGRQCVDHFRGIFSLAVYSGKELFLARDRLGVKPLYYAISADGSLVFSSEPKGILRHPGVAKEPDFDSIAEFFLGAFVFTDSSTALNRSFFKNILSVEPGHYVLFSPEGSASHQYWDLPIYGEKSGRDYAREFETTLTWAIKEQMPSEVKFGTLLSGGLDSSIVTAIAAMHTGERIPAVAIKFGGKAMNPDFEHAKIFAKHHKIDLIEAEMTPEYLMSCIDGMIMSMDEPHDTIRQLGLYAAYDKLREAGCKVALVGEGSDEFNLGYYNFSPGYGKDMPITPQLFRAAWQKRVPYAARYFTREFLQAVDFNSTIYHVSAEYYEKCKSERPIDRIQYYYAKKFLKYRLDANDRCGMAHSIEARVPFCDHRFVELAFQVPPKLNLSGGSEKNILREAFKHYLPDEIYRRQKYALPESKDLGLYRLLAAELDKNIRDADPRVWEILDKSFIISLNGAFRERISMIENGKVAGSSLTREILMNDEVGLRVKHVFLALTFLRWFDMNFGAS